MDTHAYRYVIRQILTHHIQATPLEDNIETLAVCDETAGHYMLIEIGWQPPRRIYNVIFHLRIRDDKIWIEQDWTEQGVARELLEAGVPPDRIELGFQPPEIRPYPELALLAHS
jgi:hypothetical protein